MNGAPEFLPRFYAITPSLQVEDHSLSILQQVVCQRWLVSFIQLLESEIKLVQLRTKALNTDQLETLTSHCQRLATKQGVELILNGPPDLAEQLGMAGLHLTSQALMESDQRPLSDDFLVAASCHSMEELKHAEEIGVDFACLSPVKPVKAYQSDYHLGIDAFRVIVSGCSIPVFGLGGLVKQDLADIVRAGGQGVAGISAFWH